MARVSLIVCCAAVVLGRTLHASAPPQCVRATLSQSGSVLVVNDLYFADPMQDSGHPQRSVFRLYGPMYESSERLRVNSAETAWVGPLWQIDFTSMPGQVRIPLCSSVLVTNDAEFLIVIGADTQALTIYRRPPFGPSTAGVRIRSFTQQEFGVTPPFMDKGYTPAWYAAGRFDLTLTDLTFTDRTHRRFRIHLATGTVAESGPHQ